MVHSLDVVIVGAGPAGLGCAHALRECGVEKLFVLEREEVGASFVRWPAQMRLLTPSFHSNPFGMTDLNAINPYTSPADYLGSQHPTGEQYASYLRACASHYNLPVETGVSVNGLERHDDHFEITTNVGRLRARFVIWAVGEFHTPDDGGIRGAQHCLHSSKVSDWSKLEGSAFTIVGGQESGMDAAMQLAWLGKEVHVLSRGEPWGADHSDPSRSLVPSTRDRLRRTLLEAPGRIEFYKNADIREVKRINSRWWLLDNEGEPFESQTAPILCTGFRPAPEAVRELFDADEDGFVFSEAADESTRTAGLYYSGPSLRHRRSLFCFIYKFRARFGVVARSIAGRLGLAWEKPLEPWRKAGFMMEDLECCTDCQCGIEQDQAPVAHAADYNVRDGEALHA